MSLVLSTQPYNVMPRYIVFGAGAIGSILGAALHRSGQDAVGRRPHVQAIRKEGLQLMSEGVPRRIKVNTIEDLRAIKPRADDVLLLTSPSSLKTRKQPPSSLLVFTGQEPRSSHSRMLCVTDLVSVRLTFE